MHARAPQETRSHRRRRHRHPFRLQVVEVETGAETIAKVTTEAFDLLILDLYMPDINGFELLRKIRRAHSGLLPAPPTSSTVPVLVVSAESQPASIANAKALGADHYLVKPVDMEAFEGAVMRLLSGRGNAPNSSPGKRS
jgi:CheY-like chemotaxis protein